jgi:Predicted nucleotide-binding protein containing TIR-like domain
MAYKSYQNEANKRKAFTVFIIHGPSLERNKVEKFIVEKCNMKTVVLVKKFKPGFLLENIEASIVNDCDCAVALLSPDEKLANRKFTVRQNAIFEVGYCMGHWRNRYRGYKKFEPVILMKERSVQLGADLQGIQCMEYDQKNLRATFEDLGSALLNIYEAVKAGKVDGLRDAKKLEAEVEKKKMRSDLTVIRKYIRQKELNSASFKRLKRDLNDGFTHQYLKKLLFEFPDYILRIKTWNAGPGIRLLK